MIIERDTPRARHKRKKRCFVLAALLLALALPCAGALAEASEPMPGLPLTAADVVYLKTSYSSLARIEGTTYLVNDCNSKVHYFKETTLNNFIEMYNAAFEQTLPAVTALYLVESPRTLDLRIPLPQESALYAFLKARLKVDRADHLKINTLSEYFDWFYETDHHWNYLGAYEGYRDIVRLLLGEDEPLIVPTATKTFSVVFNGNSAKLISSPIARKPFTVYAYDGLPEQEVFVNGKKRVPDHMAQYFAGKVPSGVYFDHYSYFYGSYYGLVQRATHREELPNLLIMGNSLIKGVEKLLTGHFDNVYTVDTRFYKEAMKKPFRLKAFIDEYHIDYVLLLGDAMYFNTYDKIFP